MPRSSANILVVSLYAERAGSGPRLVLVHGFTQTNRCWGAAAVDLAIDHEVVRVDAPGHGRSAHVHVDLDATVPLLVAAGGPATYVGYSMGARMCLTAALADPEAVLGLVLVGGTAGIDDDDARAERAGADRATAARLRGLGLEAFLDQWLDQPLFARLPASAAFRDERLTNSVAGLTASLELAGTGAQQPSWTRLHTLTMPVLVVAGANDDKFVSLGHRMADAIGDNATIALVADAGHAAHLERPGAFVEILRPWLADHDL